MLDRPVEVHPPRRYKHIVRGGVPNTCQQQRKGAGGSALLKPGPRVILTDIDLLRIRLKLT